MVYCPKCGTEAADDARYCPSCGAELPEAADSDEDAADEESATREIEPPEPAEGEAPTSTPEAATATEEAPEQFDEAEGLFSFAVGYPGRRGWETVLGGGLVLLFSWLILPGLIAMGYFVRTTRSAAQGNAKPPNWDEWDGMLVDGLVLVLVFVPIMLVYLILIIIALRIHWSLYLIVAVLGSYPLPAIYMNYAANDDWSAAYDVSALGEHLLHKRYVIGFLLYAFVIHGLGVIVAMVLFGLALLTIIGWIVIWPMIYFYWYGIDAALWGRVYYDIHNAEGPSPT